jgi:L-histidine N-alpha-methyltransferase
MSPSAAELLAEIGAGLARPQKELPSKLFYDERGSELFEEITRLPEYYPTRAEQALLDECVPTWVADLHPRSLVELGAGNAQKTRTILDAMFAADGGAADGDAADGGVMYVPVDISADFLERTADTLRGEYPDLHVMPVAADFTRPGPLPLESALPRPALVTFLGSTIGNFVHADAVALLRRVCAALEPADRFLLGVDLRKDVAILEAAYNDARGVTAEFNLNLLRVVNRRTGADFDPSAFRHRAIYNERDHRIEMHLVSTRAQTVRIPGLPDVTLDEGETIRTEISCKYDRDSVAEVFESAGLDMVDWHESADHLFALALGASATRVCGSSHSGRGSSWNAAAEHGTASRRRRASPRR